MARAKSPESAAAAPASTPVVRKSRRRKMKHTVRTYAEQIQRRLPYQLELMARDADHLEHHKVPGATEMGRQVAALQGLIKTVLAHPALKGMEQPPRTFRSSMRVEGERVFLTGRGFLTAKAMWGEKLASGPWEFVKEEGGIPVFRSTSDRNVVSVANNRDAIDDAAKAKQAQADALAKA